ncbi:DUF427 domain-containing protein [Lichenihabitans sp. PAMC28606]|uniref:DUF427 domain-containing protein n=1 Tax=Lichenihabitans sp. PAMC28606 TaxID=2880932 RepID=UPI001D0A54A7|nr:DUF427 domain-containing protein [Lichenihabitans sp. PAMC28606]UDL93562.1 DUF427 domain-containing protein [Lichenihabitans sp. PAMC28606]
MPLATQPHRETIPSVVNLLQSPKRVRVVLNGETIVDSRDVLMLRSNHFLPVYFFPIEAVRPGVLIASGRTGRHRSGDPTALYALDVKGRRFTDAAWSFAAPRRDHLAPLENRIAFDWHAMDAWYEEDEEVFVHARDPYVRVDALQSSAHIEVVLGGEILAETRRAVLVFETHLPTRFYIPPDDVRMERLVRSETLTRCPYKGTASYWSVRMRDGSIRPDVVWDYRDPIPEIPKIKGLLAFYPDAVDQIRLDGLPA